MYKTRTFQVILVVLDPDLFADKSKYQQYVYSEAESDKTVERLRHGNGTAGSEKVP